MKTLRTTRCYREIIIQYVGSPVGSSQIRIPVTVSELYGPIGMHGVQKVGVKLGIQIDFNSNTLNITLWI